MISKGRPSIFLACVGLFVMTLLIPAITSAECLKDFNGDVYCGAGECQADSRGTVWCSRYYDGGAEKTFEGRVLCGKGKCASGSDGKVFCSSITGGAVLRDGRGRVRCYGQCEPGSAAMCENSQAGNSGD